MFPYVTESYSPEEEDILRRYVTNLDQPVFALVNLPEVVKGALFARYSRSSKSLRRLFLDEFVGDLDIAGDATIDATVGLRRAEELYERVFFEFGDDSVAQLGGVHLACEQASNLLTKVLEWGRLMSYLEQSTRYIAYDNRLSTGHYRYYRDPEITNSSFGARYIGEMDRMFDTYGALLGEVQAHLVRRYPRQEGDSELVHRQAVRAKALDALRGLLPAGSLSNVGIYGSGQGFELLLLRMRSHPLPEARAYAGLMLDELRKVIPSFLQRVDVPDRGGVWSQYLNRTRSETADLVARLWPDAPSETPAGAVSETPAGAVSETRSGAVSETRSGAVSETRSGAVSGTVWAHEGSVPGTLGGDTSVALVDFDPDGEAKVLAALVYPHTTLSEDAVQRRVHALSTEEKRSLVAAYVGDRVNRRHRPGRAFERTAYRFDLVTDYGAFRDLQRHRMLTIDWQPLGPALGYDVPEEVVEAGVGAEYEASLARSGALFEDLRSEFPEQASYAVALAFRIRYSLQMNAREAMHLIELRSSPQGHPSYRRVAQLMHRLIGDVAGHRLLADAMVHVDHGDHDLERLESERRAEARRTARVGRNP